MKFLRRAIWIVTGFIWFFWLGYEDRGLASLIAMAALIAFAIGVEGFSRWTLRSPARPTIWLLRSTVVGALAGAIVGPIAIVLALVKTSLHHHSSPDFDLVSLRFMVGQSLTWIVAGTLFGAASGFLKLSQKR